MPRSLPSIDVSGTRKDVKAPRYINRELEWLYGMWLARGGCNPRGIYFSIPKKNPDVVNQVTTIALYQFNLHVKLVDHSVYKYRIYFNSRAIKNWWMKLEIEPNGNTGVGILDVSSWDKSNHRVVTCTPSKKDVLMPHLLEHYPNIVPKPRANKKSCDLYLQNYLQVEFEDLIPEDILN